MSDTPTVIPVPGGSARLRDPDELTVRHTRAYQSILQAFGMDRFLQLVNSRTVAEAAESGRSDEDTYFAAVAELHLDFRESDLLSRMTDAVIFKWVKEIKAAGVRTPATVDEVQDLPEGVYAALAQATGRRDVDHMQATQGGDGFGVGSAGDQDSPTGASSA